MSWSALDTYLFSGVANGVVPAPTSHASPSTGQAWSDVHGSNWTVSAGVLQGVTDTTDSLQYKRDFLIAGSSTDELNQRIVTYLPAGQVGSIYNCHRYQRTGNVGNCYLVGVNFGSTDVAQVFVVQGSGNAASQNNTGGSGGVVNFTNNSAHAYTLDTSVVGTSPATITLTLTDVTTGTAYTGTYTDSTANLQQTGAMGLDITNAQDNATAQTNPVSQIQTYSYATAVTLPQANIFFPPQGWDTGTAGHAIANASGNYLKAAFTTSASAALGLSIANVFGATADAEKPTITWSIDNGAPQKLALSSANTAGGSVTLAAALAAGSHTLQLWLRGSSPFVNHWNPAADRNFLDITGFSVSTGTLVFSAVSGQLPNLLLGLGDSMMEGEGTDGFVQNGDHTSYATNDDAAHSWLPHVATALNCEYSSAAFGGQGWTAAAADGVTPGLAASWNYKYSGKAQSFAGLAYVLVNMGTNGDTSGPAGTVSTFLSSLRAACGAATRIVLFVPWSGCARAGLLADFATYQGGSSATAIDSATLYAGATDANAVLIDFGALASVGLALPAATNSAGSLYSYDTTHLSTWGNQRIAALAAKAIQAAFPPGGDGVIAHPMGARGGIR